VNHGWRRGLNKVEQKALLRELAASYSADAGGAAPSKNTILHYTGLTEEAFQAKAEQRKVTNAAGGGP